MNWQIFEHFLVLALALGAGVIAYLWRTERKEWAALDDEEDAALDEGLAAGPLTAIDPYPDPPKARDRFKPRPQ